MTPAATPLVSVVICTYNRSAVVVAAVGSVLSQTMPDLELVVVDDGSSDDTLDVLARVADDRLVIVSRPNGGLSAARNTGVARATGRYVTFLDDDDEALQGWLEAFADVWVNTDPLAVVSCGALVVEEGTGASSTRLPSAMGAAFDDVVALFLAGTFGLPRDWYLEIGGFDAALQCSHHTEFALRLVALLDEKAGSVHAIERPLIRYVRKPAEQRLRKPARVAAGVTRIVEVHRERLERQPVFLADMLATGGVAAARAGDLRTARTLLDEAVRAHPTWRHRLRALATRSKVVADLVWRSRRYRPGTSP